MRKQALIIGGTTGMGRATAELLLKDGIEVVLIARNKTNLSKAETELSTLGSLKTLQLDITDKSALSEFIKNLWNTRKRITITIKILTELSSLLPKKLQIY